MKEQSSMRSWSHKPSSQQKQSGAATAATTRRAKHWLGDVVADTQSEQAGKDQEAPRLNTESEVREPDGTGCQRRECPSSLAGGQTQRRRARHRPNDNRATAGPYRQTLGDTAKQTAGRDIRAQPGGARGATQAQRRTEGPGHSAGACPSNPPDAFARPA